MSIHALIRARRIELHMSQQALADAVGGGITRGTVQHWEREGPKSTAPKRDRVNDVARALRLHPDVLLRAMADSPADAGVAQTVSLETATVVPTIEWEALMGKSKLPPVFKVAVPDDSMAPRLRLGQMVEMTLGLEARPGDGVLVVDRHGNHYLREYRERIRGQWSAHALHAAFEPLESERDGISVVAVVTATPGRWSG